MTPPAPRYQEGFQAGVSAKSRGVRESAKLHWTVAAPVIPATFEEEVKREQHPLDALPRLLERASLDLPPDPADVFRFRWMGLRYLAPERDGFRLRVRVQGGRLSVAQWRGLAQLAQEVASGCAEINPYGGIDLQTVSVRDVAAALRQVEALGLSSRGSDGDCLRAVTCDFAPRDEAARAEMSAVHERVSQLEALAISDRAFADLPRGCVVRFCACATPWETLDDNTLVLRATDERWKVFRVQWSVGKGDLGATIPLAQVVPLCAELLRWWARDADRATRRDAALTNFCTRKGAAALVGGLESRLPFRLARADAVNNVSNPELPGLSCSAEEAPFAPLFGRWLSAQMLTLADQVASRGQDSVFLSATKPAVIPDRV